MVMTGYFRIPYLFVLHTRRDFCTLRPTLASLPVRCAGKLVYVPEGKTYLKGTDGAVRGTRSRLLLGVSWLSLLLSILECTRCTSPSAGGQWQ